MVGVFVVINLFIAVVINNLESAKEEERHRRDEQGPDGGLFRRIAQLREQLNFLENEIRGRAGACGSEQGRKQPGDGLGEALPEGNSSRFP